MTFRALAVTAGLLMASSAAAQPTPLYDPALYLHGPVGWTVPNAEQAETVYPSRAHREEIEGRAVIDCLVEADGTIKTCEVISEDPAGYGFAEAAVKLYVTYAHVDPASVEGGLKPGARRVFTVVFFL